MAGHPDAALAGFSKKAIKPTMHDAVTYFFRYKGRIGRVQFLTSVVIWMGLGIAIALGYRRMFGDLYRSKSDIITMADTAIGIIGVVICVWTFPSSLVKRCHDLGWNGAMALLFFVPLANSIILLFLLFKKGDDTPNAWGERPKIFQL